MTIPLDSVSDVYRSASSYASLTYAVPRVMFLSRSALSNVYDTAVCPATIIVARRLASS